MSKLAFIYPGQGSAKVGMGQDIYLEAPDLFEKFFIGCDRMTGRAISQYCLEGPFHTLSQTAVVQPAMFTHSLALTAYAQQLGLFPDYAAGHSLGEYTAAVAANTLSLEDGMHLVAKRAVLSHEVHVKEPGSMVAVIGMLPDMLQQLCADISRTDLVTLANRNAPTQSVLSGTRVGIAKAAEQIRSLVPAVSVITLPVSGAFHSPLMRSMQLALQKEMQELVWNDATVPLTENVTGRLITTADDVSDALLKQICSPVNWIACVHTLIAAGCDTFLEIGAGRVLTKLVRMIAPQVSTYNADSLESLRQFAHVWSDQGNFATSVVGSYV